MGQRFSTGPHRLKTAEAAPESRSRAYPLACLPPTSLPPTPLPAYTTCLPPTPLPACLLAGGSSAGGNGHRLAAQLLQPRVALKQRLALCVASLACSEGRGGCSAMHSAPARQALPALPGTQGPRGSGRGPRHSLRADSQVAMAFGNSLATMAAAAALLAGLRPTALTRAAGSCSYPGVTRYLHAPMHQFPCILGLYPQGPRT